MTDKGLRKPLQISDSRLFVYCSKFSQTPQDFLPYKRLRVESLFHPIQRPIIDFLN